jgi:phospholipid/cholesterol/gamma-HCH transport system ATP-binding protein
MIEFVDLKVSETQTLSEELRAGSKCTIIAPSDYHKNLLLGTLAGLRPPMSGKYYILNEDVFSLDVHGHATIFQHIGLIWNQGGLLSNIRVWENILLPQEYHFGKVGADIEADTLAILEDLGIKGTDAEKFLQSTTYKIPVYMKMYANLVRDMLMEPEIMIYDSIFDGLDDDSFKRLKHVVKKFANASSDRVSLFLSIDDRLVEEMESDIVIDLRKSGG